MGSAGRRPARHLPGAPFPAAARLKSRRRKWQPERSDGFRRNAPEVCALRVTACLHDQFFFHGAEIFVSVFPDDYQIFEADPAPFRIIEPGFHADDGACGQGIGIAGGEPRLFMDIQTHPVTEAVDESARDAVGIFVCGEAVCLHAAGGAVVDIGAHHAGFEHGEGFFCRLEDGCKRPFCFGVHGFAFAESPGHIAPVSGPVAAGENIAHDRFSGTQGTFADAMGRGSLRAPGDDGPVGGIALPFELGFHLTANVFTGQQLSILPDEHIMTVHACLPDHFLHHAHGVFGRLHGVTDLFDLLLIFDGAFRKKISIHRAYNDPCVAHPVCIRHGEGIGHDPLIDPGIFRQPEENIALSGLANDVVPVPHDHMAVSFIHCPGEFQNRDSDVLFPVCLVVKKFVMRIESAAVENIGIRTAGGDESADPVLTFFHRKSGS